jgi:aspartate 1-decarboxylase
MLIKMLKSKLHRARVTDTKLHYPGSIEVDTSLLQAVGMIPYESVLIADLDNGNRFETYLVPGEPGTGRIIVMGAAARLARPGDIIIILGFAYCTPEEAAQCAPKVAVLDENNRIVTQPGKESLRS